MSLWNKTTTLPQHLTTAEKRNIVVTADGYVKLRSYTDQHSRTRTKKEILVAIGGGPNGGLANTSNWHFAKVTDAWSGNTTFTNGGTCNVWVSFSEPLSRSGLAGRIKMTVSNTAGGDNMLATSNSLIYDGNKVVFRWKPSKGGTYKVQAHLMANGSATAVNTRSTNAGTELANLYSTALASNNLGSFTVYGQPDVRNITHSSNSFSGSTFVNTWITFTDPVTSSGSGLWRLTVANTAGGNNMFAYANNTTFANGLRLLFRWRPGVAGYYAVQAQTIGNTATKTLVHTTTSQAAIKIIGATASNTASPSKTVRKTS